MTGAAAAAAGTAVYECPGCGERQATRRCEDCNLSPAGSDPGGECPRCGEPVLTSSLFGAPETR